MSSHNKNTATTTLPSGIDSETDYEIGYKTPPMSTRFQKGKSGNPKGRPKGAKNKIPPMNEERLKSIVMEEAYRTIPVQDRGKNVSMSIAQAVIRSLSVNAVKGKIGAQRLFTEILAREETSRKQQHEDYLDNVLRYKIKWEKEFERCDRFGIPRPEPVPHPDSFIIDMKLGTVSMNGPLTQEDKDFVEHWIRQKADLTEELELLQGLLSAAKSKSDREFYQMEIDRNEKVIALIAEYLPD